MGEILVENVVKREEGYLYYIDSFGNACRAKLVRGRKKGIGKKINLRNQQKKEAQKVDIAKENQSTNDIILPSQEVVTTRTETWRERRERRRREEKNEKEEI